MAPQRFVGELNALPSGALDRFEVVAGHHGLNPVGERTRLITVLRDPVRRALSHYRARGPDGAPGAEALQPFDGFGAVLDDPVYGWIARNYQARWLAIPFEPPGTTPAGLPPGVVPRGDSVEVAQLEDGELERRASAALRRCALVGTAERLDDFVRALGRLVGRPLAAPPRLNVGPPSDFAPEAMAARVRAQSRVDERLRATADAQLDRALETLPPLPPDPVVALPYRHNMGDALFGTGWHARVHTPEAGWHRWTGPGTRSDMRLPVRLAGPARLEVAVLSACDDEAMATLRISVQDRPVPYSLEPRPFGKAALADVRLDPHRPLTLALEVAHTRHLVDAATGTRSPDPAGLAIGTVGFTAIR
jgi:hypothetical protein